ncbi:hypothetical protein EYR40_002935 [Pleurotus pulmonarius]|nr:hypothetical protein EYR40_002935 [Pleurotus pulmonarius]
MNVAKLASQSSAALNEGVAIVRKVIKSLPPSARFTTSELYQLALKESPSPTFKPFLRSGNGPTVHGIGLPSSKPGPKPPHPDHPISSKTFLKREILPVLEGKREIKLVSAPRLPSRPPAPQNGKQGKAAQKQAKNSAPPLPASTVSGWVWKPVEKTELHTIRSLVTVDVDSMDPEVATRHTSSEYSLAGMTSNQAIVYMEAVKPERKQLVLQAIALAKSKMAGANESALVDQVVDILTVLLAKEVYPIITGNVHVQTSPAAAYNTEETVKHAKTLVALFNDQGIPKDRVCIKIPSTPQSLIACRMLSEMGIQTLGTCLFSLPQALAAAQANCICISPYFNELRVHFEPATRKVYETPDDDPMCAIIHSIVQHFKAIGTKTLVMPASIVTVLALVRLNPDHLTLSGAVLDQLAAHKPVEASLLQPKTSINKHESYANTDGIVDSLLPSERHLLTVRDT